MALSIDPAVLRAFCSVAEHGSLSRAAADLDLAQSVLSRRISALERELRIPLFHRTGRGVTPTDVARRLLPRARAILAETGALIREARGERSSPTGTVEIGLVPAVTRPLAGILVQRLRKDFPRIRLRVFEGYSGQIEEWLATGRIDLGIFNRYGRARVRGAEPLSASRIVLVGRRDRLRFDGEIIPFRALQSVPLVLPTRPNPLLSMTVELASRQGFELDIALEAGSGTIVHDAIVQAGLATLAPDHLARREYANPEFRVVQITQPVLHQKTWLSFTTQRPLGIAARTVGKLLQETATILVQ